MIRLLAGVLALALLGAGGVTIYMELDRRSERIENLEQGLDAARAENATAESEVEELSSESDQLRNRLASLQTELQSLREAGSTVKPRTITKRVSVWVPNGKGVEVEVTGFEGQVEIHDVQLTHAFGYSDFVGIAINKSGQTITYAEVGCTFLDTKGAVLTNAIDNKDDWAPGASWGFDCSAPVDATGGILRVSQMS